jgi:hypothetical protein
MTTDLTKESLDELNALACHPELGPAVKSVTVIANIYDTSELGRMLSTKRKRITTRTGPFTSTTEPRCTNDELLQAMRDVEWLRTRTEHLNSQPEGLTISTLESALCAFGKLDVIDFDASVTLAPGKVAGPEVAPEWHAVWTRAAQAFRITTLAMARSKVQVETLSIYRNTKRCSIPSADITDHAVALENSGFAEAGKYMQNLALSMSTAIVRDFSKVVEARERLTGIQRLYQDNFGVSEACFLTAEDAEAMADVNFPGVARLLKLTPNLEALDLHLCNTLRGPIKNYDQIFNIIARDVHLPALEQCFLRGIPTTAESLLSFLEKHPKINDLDLREVRLTTGSWEPIFAHLSGMLALTKLRMSNLRDMNGRLFSLFPASGYTSEELQAKFWSYPCLDGNMVHTMEFGAKEIKKGLKFLPTPQERPMGSPWFMSWMESTKGMYSLH